MKLAIVGCRDFNYYNFIERKINKVKRYEKKQISQIISGGASTLCYTKTYLRKASKAC